MTLYIGIVYDYDNVEPYAVFGPYADSDTALEAGQSFVHQKVIRNEWSADVLDPDYEDIQVIVEPIYPSPEQLFREQDWNE